MNPSIFENTEAAFAHKSTAELRKAYWMFKAVDSPFMTKLGAAFMRWGIYVPGVKFLLKKTIFAQFCGGETQTESLKTIQQLGNNGVGSILDFSVEGKDEEEEYERAHQEILDTIDLAHRTDAIPFVVFKPTAFGSIHLYEKVGRNVDLNIQETTEWNAIRNRFETVFEKAHQNDVTVMVDAEESWMQDAADELVEEMMQKYNQQRCIVVNTLQMYRHDRLAYLKAQYQKAEEGNYLIGFKVVRGAYMEKERLRAKEKGYPSPIQPNKEATDRDYNAALDFILERHHRISLFAGTHNEISCKRLIDLLAKHNLSKDYHKIWAGQLLGMSDNISFVLANLGYNVAKYVPYGPVKEVVPYLIRRAEENTSVAGQSNRELGLIVKELKRRKN